MRRMLRRYQPRLAVLLIMVVVVLLGWGEPVEAQVQFDNSVKSGFQWGVTKVTTPAFAVGTGANRAAMIMVTMTANTATNITAKLGGVTGTPVPGTDSGNATA